MTRPLIWSEAFAVGHGGLDKEHRRLVAHINDLCTCVTTRDAAEIESRLHALTAEADRHLQHETVVLREFQRDLEDPPNQHVSRQLGTTISAAIEDHIADHVTLQHRLAEVTRTVRNGHWTEGFSLCRVVEMWFLDHAVKYDIQIKTMIQSMSPLRHGHE
jgi:hemerythrin